MIIYVSIRYEVYDWARYKPFKLTHLIIIRMANGDEKSIPVSKCCELCKEEKLLSEYDHSDESVDKRSPICKKCAAELENDCGTCCETHFNESLIGSVFHHLEIALEQAEIIRKNGFEIPPYLIKTMFNLAHLSGARCRYDSCVEPKESS